MIEKSLCIFELSIIVCEKMSESIELATTARSVRVKLRASRSLVEYFKVESIEDSPFVAVPCSLGRSGLTSVVNHFLAEFSLKSEFQGEFEFFDVEHETLLKGNLERHLKKFKLTEEDELVLEYAFPKTSKFVAEGPGAPIPDWISCLCKVDDVVFAGSFDGSIVTSRLQKKGLVVRSIEANAHTAQITAATAFKIKNIQYVATASKDASIAIRPLMPNNDDNDKLGDRVATCTVGHGRSFETVCS